MLALFTLALATTLSSCAPAEAEQLGSRAEAAVAADDFLRALTRGRALYAWEHLTPATREELFDGNADEFTRQVTRADWSAFQWEIGPMTDYEISWGVHVEVDSAQVPDFLVDSRLAGPYDDIGIVLLVQFLAPGRYAVAGQSLDTDLR